MSDLPNPRQEVINYIKTFLGEGMIDVELDPRHYQVALDRALNKYRQRGDSSVEESYMFLTLEVDTNTYTLPTGPVSVSTVANAINIYQYELQQNEAKRSINILNNTYVNEIEKELVDLMNNNGY